MGGSLPETTEAERLAKAIYDALRQVNDGQVVEGLVQGEPAPNELTLIDGQFDLVAVARLVFQVKSDWHTQ